MKKNCDFNKKFVYFLLTIFASPAFLTSCDNCTTSDLHKTQCNGSAVQECVTKDPDGWDSEQWETVQDCVSSCPIGTAPSCTLGECHCSAGSSSCYSIGKYRCKNGNIEKCNNITSNDGMWEIYKTCKDGCPVESGATSSCSENSCQCSVPENIACDYTGYYRCNGSNIEKCTGLTEYNGAIWKQIKNCSNAFASNGAIIDGGACPMENGKKQYSEIQCSPKIKKAFRGKWRRLDKNEDYYLGTNGITDTSWNTPVIPTRINIIDNNMIELTVDNETFRLIRNSITDAKLKLSVKRAFSSTRSPSGSGVGGIDVIIENTSDEGEVYEQQSDSNGDAEFNNIVSGEYDISVGSTTVRGDIANYLNAGNFYLSWKGYIYKTTRTNQDAIYYGESRNDSTKGNKYDITLQIHNLGDTDAPATSISLTTNDSAVKLTAEPKILGTIEPQKYVSYSFSITTVPFDTVSSLKNEAYHDAEFAVAVKDSKGEIWEDIVTIRIYKKEVPIYLYYTMNSNPFILLSPHREIITMSSVVWVPYRPDAKYKLIAQSLSLENEGAYSIGVGTWDDEKWKTEQKDPEIINSYEPNNIESQAKTVYMNSQTTSYLNKGEKDIDFWLIDMSK